MFAKKKSSSYYLVAFAQATPTDSSDALYVEYVSSFYYQKIESVTEFHTGKSNLRLYRLA